MSIASVKHTDLDVCCTLAVFMGHLLIQVSAMIRSSELQGSYQLKNPAVSSRMHH